MYYIQGYRDGLEGFYDPPRFPLKDEDKRQYIQGHKRAWRERQNGTLPVIDSKLQLADR